MTSDAPAADNYALQRKQMVERQLQARKIADPRVLAAFSQVPRHMFVPEDLREEAYRDRPLPIGQGQTISQPFVVALMLELARLSPGDRVLDVGGGSGYQAALLAAMGCRVTSVEIVPELARLEEERLRRLGYCDVKVLEGDARRVLDDDQTFDAIIAAAAPPSVPQALVSRLAPGGRLVVPVGERYQNLLVIEKLPDGTLRQYDHGGVAFVPMTGEE